MGLDGRHSLQSFAEWAIPSMGFVLSAGIRVCVCVIGLKTASSAKFIKQNYVTSIEIVANMNGF